MTRGLLLASAVAPTAFNGAAEVLSVVVLLVSFVMLRQALLRSQVLVYAFQSLAVSVLTGAIAASQHAGDLYALAAASFVLKVLVVPALVLHVLSEAEVDLASSQRLRVATLVLVGVVVSAFAFVAVGDAHIRGAGQGGLPIAAFSTAAATVLVSLVVVAARSDVVSQVVGCFSMENGIAVASLAVAARMPVVLELGFLFDLLVAAIAFALIMRAHHRRAGSLSTETLERLRG